MKITIELYGSEEEPRSIPTRREIDGQIKALERAMLGRRSVADIDSLLSIRSILRGIREQLYK